MLKSNRASDPTRQAYVSLLGQCNGSRYLALGRHLHFQIAGELQQYKDDVFLCNLLVQMYGKCGSVDEGNSLFKQMPHHNIYSWNILIAALAESGHLLDARNHFEAMPEWDSVSWNTMLSAYSQLGHLDDVKELFDRMPEPNVVSWNSLVTAYYQNGDLSKSKKVFHSMPERNIVSWNCMLTAYVQQGDHSGAECLYNRMPEHNITSWNLILSAYSSAGMVDWARGLFVRIPEWNQVTWNILIGTYALNGHIVEAREIFDQMKDKSIATWNLMIKAYVSIDQGYEALQLYSEMDLAPDEITFTSLLEACDQCHGRILHQEIARLGFLDDSIVANATMGMFFRCGDVAAARKIFATIPQRTAVSWAETIAAFAGKGHGRESRELFQAMCVAGFAPSDKGFVGILSACSHGGLLEEGISFFLAMIEDFAAIPGDDHLTCVIDLVSRAGQLARAEEIATAIQERRCDGFQWKTLLGACRIHGESTLAARAAKNVLDLGAGTGSSSYVLLYGALPATSNIRTAG